MRTLSRAALAAGLATVLGLGGAVAWASWTAHATASGHVSSDLRQDLTVLDATTLPTHALYPGGNGDLAVRIENDNSYDLRVFAIFQIDVITADSTHASEGCTGTSVGVAIPHSHAAVSWVVHAHQTESFQANGAVHMSNAAVDGCAGATFTVPIGLSALSVT